MNAHRSRIIASSRSPRLSSPSARRRLRGHRHVQARRLQRLHRTAGRTGSADGANPHDPGRRNHRRLALPPWPRLQRRHARARSRSRTGADKSASISKGEAFETSEGRVHRAYNLGSEDAMEYNMFVGPPDRPIGVNIPNNEHRCGPPSTVEECQNGGWATFNHPAPFANQGACVAYVNHRRADHVARSRRP